MKTTPVTHADLVVKSNALIPSMTRLNLNELRLVAFCVAHILPAEDKQFDEVTAHTSDLASLFNIPIDRAYSLIKEIMISINSKPAEYEDEKRKSLSAWFINIDYYSGEGKFTFLFNPRLTPYLLDLKGNYTSYRLKDVYQFKAASTWHIYEVIRQFRKLGVITFELDQFKALINVGGQYSRWNNLKFKILDPAINEINAYTNISVEYEIIKRGVKVDKLKFYIKENESTMTKSDKIKRAVHSLGESENHLPEFAKLLREEYRVSPKQAKQLANVVYHHERENEAKELLPKIRERFEKIDKPKTTLGGYVFRTLKDELTQGKLVDLYDRK